MEFSQYQVEATKTAIYPDRGAIGGLLYATLGLTNEAGEVAGKLKKVLRDNGGELTQEKRSELAAELGDVLWYCAAIADELGYSLAYIAKQNIQKLYDRAERGVIGGSGDNR